MSNSLEETRRLAQGFKTVPLWASFPADGYSPSRVFKILKAVSKHCFILESAESSETTGRYTFLGYDPTLELTCADGEVTLKGGAAVAIKTDNPAEQIKRVISDNAGPKAPGLPPFTGGLVGSFAYESVRYAEPKLNRFGQDTGEDFKDVDLMLFDKVIAFDRALNAIYLIVNIKTDALDENYAMGLRRLDEMRRLIAEGEPAALPKLALKSAFAPMFSKERFCAMVERAKAYIREGDIFQVVLSNRYEARAEGSLFHTYEILRETNPSPYMFYFSSDNVEIAGAAPETLVKLTNREVTTFPLAGTRPRGKTEEEDAAITRELLSDPKELAEHNMLVDLGRNDLGRISAFGTVKVTEYMSVEKFSHVMHIGSTVVGELREGLDGTDAISALLPAGTLSGAPKFRACEIIGELEGGKRGIYGGAIGYLALNGDMDTCIAIRIAFKRRGVVYIRSGAGIVADSVAESEYNECENKLKAVKLALERAGGAL